MKLLRYDMSEYSQEAHPARFVGASPDMLDMKTVNQVEVY